jgi:AcrR family transcriptional regulator
MKKHTETEVQARRERTLEAAWNVFLRLGFARTTIGDIAKEAELHRPALSALVPLGKNELFEAVLLRFVTREIDRYRSEIRRFRKSRAKLMHCIEEWSLGGLQMSRTYPASRDAFNVDYIEVRRMYDVLVSFYSELFRDVVAESTLRITADELAKLLVYSLRGIRQVAADEATLRPLLTKQVDVFFAALQATATPR